MLCPSISTTITLLYAHIVISAVSANTNARTSKSCIKSVTGNLRGWAVRYPRLWPLKPISVQISSQSHGYGNLAPEDRDLHGVYAGRKIEGHLSPPFPLHDHDPAMTPELNTRLVDDTVNSFFPCRQGLWRHHGNQAALLGMRLVIDTAYNRRHERTCYFQYLLDQLECH